MGAKCLVFLMRGRFWVDIMRGRFWVVFERLIIMPRISTVERFCSVAWGKYGAPNAWYSRCEDDNYYGWCLRRCLEFWVVFEKIIIIPNLSTVKKHIIIPTLSTVDHFCSLAWDHCGTPNAWFSTCENVSGWCLRG
jgi:hypothetical protein